MGDLTSFGKPTFWLFWMEYLCIIFSHVIIYYIILLLHKFCYCTLTQYRLVLCSNFSLLWCEFCMFDWQFCECNCSISWVQFAHGIRSFVCKLISFLIAIIGSTSWLGAYPANWRVQFLSYGPISKDHLDSIQSLWVESWDGDIVERERSLQDNHGNWGRTHCNYREN